MKGIWVCAVKITIGSLHERLSLAVVLLSVFEVHDELMRVHHHVLA